MTHFSTNLDYAKSLVVRFSNKRIEKENFSVGDLVEVHREPGFILELEVVRRTWSDSELYVELHLPKHRFENISHFSRVMRERGFHE